MTSCSQIGSSYTYFIHLYTYTHSQKFTHTSKKHAHEWNKTNNAQCRTTRNRNKECFSQCEGRYSAQKYILHTHVVQIIYTTHIKKVIKYRQKMYGA